MITRSWQKALLAVKEGQTFSVILKDGREISPVNAVMAIPVTGWVQAGASNDAYYRDQVKSFRLSEPGAGIKERHAKFVAQIKEGA